MKLNKFFLFSAAVGLALASCSDDVAVTSPDNGQVAKGNTYVGMTVSMASPGTRAGNTGDGEYVGEDYEKAINKDMVFYWDADKRTFTKMNPETTVATEGKYYRLAAGKDDWQTAAWQVNPVDNQIPMGVVLNKNDFYGEAVKVNDLATIKLDTKGAIVAGIAQFAGVEATATDFSAGTGFTMSSTIDQHKIAAGIDDPSKVTNEASNLFPFQVSRVLSKGMVYTSDEIKNDADQMIDVKTGTVVLGQVYNQNLTFAGVNGGLLVNAFNVPGESAINTLKSEKGVVDNATEAVKAGLFRMGVAAKQAKAQDATNDDLGILYKAQPVNLKSSPAVTDKQDVPFTAGDKAVYFFENTADAAALQSAKDNKNGYDRFASAKVYVTYVPATIWTVEYLTEEPKSDVDSYTKKTVTYKDESTKDIWYKKDAKLTEVKPADKWVDSTNKSKGVKSYIYSEAKGKYYTDKVVAAIDGVDVATDGFTYKNGRGAYMALWNRVESEGNVFNGGNTLRNYIYVLEITGFYGRPMNNDPSDPNDPNLPIPDTNEPTPNVDKDPNPTAKTYMAVKAQVLKWKVSKREVNLGEY